MFATTYRFTLQMPTVDWEEGQGKKSVAIIPEGAEVPSLRILANPQPCHFYS